MEKGDPRRQRSLGCRTTTCDAITRAREISHRAFDPGVTHKPNDTIRINPVPSTRSPLIAWIHRTALPGLTIWRLLAEIKHDGYRLQVRREGDAVRLFMRRGYDWTGRYPAIAVTTLVAGEAARLPCNVSRQTAP
jgi:hypothetical protein